MSESINPFAARRTWGPTCRYPSVLGIPKIQHDFIAIAGPCAIESSEQVHDICKVLSGLDITFMRGGVFRAGTYPPNGPFGLQTDSLQEWWMQARSFGIKIIVEVIDIRDLDMLSQYADGFQVGARQSQGYVILSELANCGKTVTLKRGKGDTLDEFLGAAEYLARGNCKPILIERGGASYLNHVRWEPSISLIAAIKRMTGLPIIIDASHGTGRRDLVGPVTLAGIAAGADGCLIETHPTPELSYSDADQAIPLAEFPALLARARFLHRTLREWERP